MQDDAPKTIARTYRFDTPLYRAMKRFQSAMRPVPSEKQLVQTAIEEFMECREREAGKRAARR